MSEPRVIKKYPNRRLYDTAESRYITLADIRKLVVENVEFVVMDKKTQEDITRSILLQVIAEQEHMGDPLMSRDFLSQVIRSYGGVMQGVIGSYLEQSLKLFAAQQREIRERARNVAGPDPMDGAAALAQRNYQRWQSVQDEIFRLMSTSRAREEENAAHAAGS
jgi:polyhydroxyalkanoate synthesis repressor PhaR